MRRLIYFFLILFILITGTVIFVGKRSLPADKETNDTTSYTTDVFLKGETSPPKNLNVLFFGDLMLDRSVAIRMEKYGNDYPFINIQKLLSENDIVVANLEGVFTDNESISRKNNSILRFTFNPEVALILKENKFDVVSQANNHSNDFGKEGYLDSVEILKKAGISAFGSYFNDEESFLSIDKVNQKIAFIGFNEFSYENYENIFSQIEKAREDHFVVVFAHWGVEYEKESSNKQKEYARKFIDAGADIIIGSHPHVAQEVDIYKNKLIFYSLGNFVFDQDFSKETTEGLGVGLSIRGEEVETYLVPFNIKNSQVVFKEPSEREEFLKALSLKSSPFLQEEILSGKIELSR